MQDPRTWLRASLGHGLHVPRPHAGRRLRRAGLPRHRLRRGGPMNLSTAALLVCALIASIGVAFATYCDGELCGEQLMAAGWRKVASCSDGHAWSYVLTKQDRALICTGVIAGQGTVEFPC